MLLSVFRQRVLVFKCFLRPLGVWFLPVHNIISSKKRSTVSIFGTVTPQTQKDNDESS